MVRKQPSPTPRIKKKNKNINIRIIEKVNFKGIDNINIHFINIYVLLLNLIKYKYKIIIPPIKIKNIGNENQWFLIEILIFIEDMIVNENKVIPIIIWWIVLLLLIKDIIIGITITNKINNKLIDFIILIKM